MRIAKPIEIDNVAQVLSKGSCPGPCRRVVDISTRSESLRRVLC